MQSNEPLAGIECDICGTRVERAGYMLNLRVCAECRTRILAESDSDSLRDIAQGAVLRAFQALMKQALTKQVPAIPPGY